MTLRRGEDVEYHPRPESPLATDNRMTLSVRIVQPAFPKYRLPVFGLLGRQEGIRLSVWADLERVRATLAGVTSGSDFECVHAPLRMWGPFAVQKREIEAARAPGADVVIFSWISRDPLLGHALKVARRSGKGTILWGHGFGTKAPTIGGWVRDRLVRKADACLFYGPTSRDAYAKRVADPSRLFVAPNAIDQTPIAAAREHWNDPERLREFRRSKGLGNDVLILFLSRLEYEKRPDLLLDALAIIRRSRSDVRAVFIGDGRQRQALEEKAAALGLKQCVTFAGPILQDDELAPWCCAASCMAHPGALGLSIFHAFGFGLPVITSHDLSMQMPEVETMVEGQNGLFYRYPDPEALASKILAVVSDRALHATLSSGARRTVEGPDGRDIPAMVAGFMRAIRFAAAQRGR